MPVNIAEILTNHDLPDKELLLAHVIGKNSAFVFAHPEYTLSDDQERLFASLTRRRADGEPLAYIIGTKEFFGRAFTVTHDTLIPRPETELIIELLQKNPPVGQKHLYIDIGTGTGNIIITLAKELPPDKHWTFCATDISQEALRVAQENAARHDAQRIHFFHSDLLSSTVVHDMMQKHDDITLTANLPYVDTATKDALLEKEQSRGLQYEPGSALWSDDNGLAHYRKLLVQTKNIVETNAQKSIRNLYEIDPLQKDLLSTEIAKLFPDATISFHKDLAGHWRICEWST
jgi:release factor glutamine methyltransferase